MIPSPRRWRAAALAGLALALALAGCSGSHTAASTTASSTTLEITTTTVHYVPQYVSVGGHKVLIPTEEHHEPIDRVNGVGQNVIITAKGFEPFELYAQNKTPIVFTNLTDTTEVVRFHHFPNITKSPPIRPGRSWSFEYNAAITLVYGNPRGTHLGQLYIGLCPPYCGPTPS